jgi:hypothetical protein
VNTRKIWNQHAYHVTNVDDDGGIPLVETNSWEQYNTYRCNHIAMATACEDYTVSCLQTTPATTPDSIVLSSRIGNGGAVAAGICLDVAVYDGDPTAGGALLAVSRTTTRLASGAYEDISFTLSGLLPGEHTFYIIVDDDGTGRGKVLEVNEHNNQAFILVGI